MYESESTSGDNIQCYDFKFKGAESEELFMEKYTQVIVSEGSGHKN